MAELKTQRTKASVKAFLDRVADARKRRDAKAVLAMMQEVTNEKPAMWGPGIVGFGSYAYRQRNGQEAHWPIVGFSPRKDSLTLYIMPGFRNQADLLGRLGKHKTGVSCLYIKSLDDVHLPTLRTLVQESVAYMRSTTHEERLRQAAGQEPKVEGGRRKRST
jgi:hypothetical protein